MFDVGFSELLLCFIIALIVLGPERLPKVAQTIGRFTGQARAYMRNLSAELERETQAGELKKQLDDVNRIAREQLASLETQTQQAREQLKAGIAAESDKLP